MELEYMRDILFTGLLFGIISIAWFGWAQENPPEKLRPWLGIGAVIGMVIAGVSGYLVVKNWHTPTIFSRDGVGEMFGIVVALEVLLCLVGAIVLHKRKKPLLIAPWIALIVGLHFIPLVYILGDWWLGLLAALMTVGVGLVHVFASKLPIKQNTATCIVMGMILVIYAVRSLMLGVLAL